MADEVIASIAISFFIINLAFGTIGFVIGINTNTFDSFEGIREQLQTFADLSPQLGDADPSRDRIQEEARRRDEFDCGIFLDGLEQPCGGANPIFPLYPPDPDASGPLTQVFSIANFFGNVVNVIRLLWNTAIFFYVIPVGLTLGAFEMMMLIPPYVGGVSPIGIAIFTIDAFITIGFGLSFLLTMIERIKVG